MSSVEIDLKALLEAGVHFGHKTSRWHPKMAPYIHSKRGDSHIIDLVKTAEALETGLAAVSKVIAKGGKVLLVGTNNQLKEEIQTVAEATSQPFVNERWVGGTLTNHKTINLQVRKLHKLEKQMATGELEKRYSKLEVQRFQEEIDLLNTRYSGIKNMAAKPAMMFVLDAHEEGNAIKEANKVGVPVMAICDTNVNPEGIDYIIPANDDAIKGLRLILDYFKQTVLTATSNQDQAIKTAKKSDAKPAATKTEAKTEDQKGDK